MATTQKRNWAHTKKVHEWGVVAQLRTADNQHVGEFWQCQLCGLFSEQGQRPFWTLRQFASMSAEKQQQGLTMYVVDSHQRWRLPPPAPTARGRFDISTCDNLWQVHDRRYGTTFRFGDGKKGQQEQGRRFIRQYVKRHGDINLNSMPYTMEEAPHWNPGDRGEEVQ